MVTPASFGFTGTNQKELVDGKPFICISAQLIEAGVDVDFRIRVIRSYAESTPLFRPPVVVIEKDCGMDASPHQGGWKRGKVLEN